jgi:hypothetical protein
MTAVLFTIAKDARYNIKTLVKCEHKCKCETLAAVASRKQVQAAAAEAGGSTSQKSVAADQAALVARMHSSATVQQSK